jgi:DnaJ-class molecular chaperone
MFDHGGIDGLERFERGEGQIRKGPTARAEVHLTLEQLYSGATRRMNINRNVYCDKCRGSGAKDGKLTTCKKCKGQGVVMERINMGGMQMQMQQHCNVCQGKGTTMASKCPGCKGRRLVNENKEIELQIEKGMKSGDTIVLEKEGEQVPDMARGDLVFTVKQRPHKKFKRVGNNLYIDIQISLEESLLGFSRTLSHLDGHEFTVSNDKDEII